jgi:hypothetical protein
MLKRCNICHHTRAELVIFKGTILKAVSESQCFNFDDCNITQTIDLRFKL